MPLMKDDHCRWMCVFAFVSPHKWYAMNESQWQKPKPNLNGLSNENSVRNI